MAEFYQEMRGIASALLAEFGQGEIQYVALTSGAGAADNPGPAQEVPTTIDAVARGVSFKYIDQTNIVASDLQITMPGDGPEPNMKGFIKVDRKQYKIVKIIRKPAAGVVVAWTIIFRK